MIVRIINDPQVVMDVGAGSGILSFFAQQAGAKRVYQPFSYNHNHHTYGKLFANVLDFLAPGGYYHWLSQSYYITTFFETLASMSLKGGYRQIFLFFHKPRWI